MPKYPEALGGQGRFPGAHVPESGYVGGSTSAKKDIGIESKEYPASTKLDPEQDLPTAKAQSEYRSQYNGGTAPSYVADVVGQLGNAKPKGNNLREGGFDSNPNTNASFTADIGTRKDPGRLAENKFQRMTQESAADAGVPDRQKSLDSQHWYQPLKRDQKA